MLEWTTDPEDSSTTLIPLSNRHGVFTKIDTSMAEEIKKRTGKMCMNNWGYVYARDKIIQTKVGLHRLVMFLQEGIWSDKNTQVNHINREKLDNRSVNLEFVSASRNQRERTVKPRNPTGKHSRYPGVSWHKQARKWLVHIKMEGKRKHLGYFVDEKEAGRAYMKKLLEICPEINHLPEWKDLQEEKLTPSMINYYFTGNQHTIHANANN